MKNINSYINEATKKDKVIIPGVPFALGSAAKKALTFFTSLTYCDKQKGIEMNIRDLGTRKDEAVEEYMEMVRDNVKDSTRYSDPKLHCTEEEFEEYYDEILDWAVDLCWENYKKKRDILKAFGLNWY